MVECIFCNYNYTKKCDLERHLKKKCERFNLMTAFDVYKLFINILIWTLKWSLIMQALIKKKDNIVKNITNSIALINYSVNVKFKTLKAANMLVII